MRIGVQILGFERQLLNSVNAANAAAQLSTLRLATGRRINSASDDPSGFIELSHYERRLNVVNSSIKNVNRSADMVTQIQSNLSQIRDQIDIIRGAALEDVGGQLTTGQRAVNQAAIDGAIVAINQLANSRINSQQILNKVKSDVVGTEDRTEISSLKGGQVDDVQVNSIDANSSVVLSGSVTAPSEAELTYKGGAGSTVQATATFSVTGSLGSTNIAITQGESLIAVRDRVNQVSAGTGVVASVNGDDLVFKSADTGAGAHIEVQAITVDQIVDVSGVNPLQVASFTVSSLNPTSSVTLTGKVKDKAERGELNYDSNNGNVKENATFTLSGNLGSATISVTKNENISGVRDRINAETGNTGVVASISGDDIVFNSVNYGSSEFVYVEETSGTFSVSGGQNSGAGKIDYGKDAVTTINDTDYVGDGNLYSNLTVGPGTFTFEFAPEFEDDFDDISVTSNPGVFSITGGNGDGTANGNDLRAIINGQNLTATADEFTFATGTGNFTISFADGFSGTFDPITVTRADVDVIKLTGEETELKFSLFGDGSPSSLKVTGVSAIALGSVTGSLSDLVTGGSKGGLDGNAADAVAIADEALDELNLIEARVNAFSNSILASAASFNASLQVNVEESIERINNVDQAKETAQLSRSLLLADTAQAAMFMVNQQRQSMASMLLRIAGLQ